MIEPTPRFGDTYYFMDSPINAVLSFDKLEDGVVPLYPDGTYFCGPREYKFTIKVYH
jgi:hypothetical protein